MRKMLSVVAFFVAWSAVAPVVRAQTAITECGKPFKFDQWCEKGEQVIGQSVEVPPAIEGRTQRKELSVAVPANMKITRIQLTLTTSVGPADVPAKCVILEPKMLGNQQLHFRCVAYVKSPDPMVDQYAGFEQMAVTGTVYEGQKVVVTFVNDHRTYKRVPMLRVYYKPYNS